MNFCLPDDSVVVAVADAAGDKVALAQITVAFPDRDVVAAQGRTLRVHEGGGVPSSITRQLPVGVPAR